VVFNARFSRYRRLLHFIANRVLGDARRADEAVGNCWLSASRNPPWFEYDGAFCSWLVRVLIDEALAMRGPDHETRSCAAALVSVLSVTRSNPRYQYRILDYSSTTNGGLFQAPNRDYNGLGEPSSPSIALPILLGDK
jgi:DNA-directed RNA polymerase specialized sigma subunit, sigma24 homolog